MNNIIQGVYPHCTVQSRGKERRDGQAKLWKDAHTRIVRNLKLFTYFIILSGSWHWRYRHQVTSLFSTVRQVAQTDHWQALTQTYWLQLNCEQIDWALVPRAILINLWMSIFVYLCFLCSSQCKCSAEQNFGPAMAGVAGALPPALWCML